MTPDFISFDETWSRVRAILSEADLPQRARPVYLVRDAHGRIRISAPLALEDDGPCNEALDALADRLDRSLGPHSDGARGSVLYLDDQYLNLLTGTRRELPELPGVFAEERLFVGEHWWAVNGAKESGARRFTLYSVKGGLGCSTTAAALSRHLAAQGERVLVMDLDLESPGLAAVLEPERRPRFGVTDWFVENLVGQGDHVAERMLGSPAWADALGGEVRIAPADGATPGEYLAKVGRVYMERLDSLWPDRLAGLVERLEAQLQPTTVLIESRSRFHDIAAATLTDLGAEVLLFATDAESVWADYEILFKHWKDKGLADAIRDRLTFVSALTPERDREACRSRFRSRTAELMRTLYGDSGAFPEPLEIGWHPGLAAGASLRTLDAEAVASAYGNFWRPLAERLPRGEFAGAQAP